MINPLNETVFEEHIAEYLVNSDLYNQRKSTQFDIERLCDPGDGGTISAPATSRLE